MGACTCPLFGGCDPLGWRAGECVRYALSVDVAAMAAYVVGPPSVGMLGLVSRHRYIGAGYTNLTTRQKAASL